MEPQNPGLSAALSDEEVSAAAAAIDAVPDLGTKARRALQTVQAWASPSLVACLVRDPEAQHGWRAVPELASSPLPTGFEESFARQMEGASPGSFAGPKLIQPPQSFGGVKVKPRDSWLLPWSVEAGAEGFLVLRGVARPYPANLADAVARVCRSLWDLVSRPREPGPQEKAGPEPSPRQGRTSLLEQAAAELAQLAKRLEEEADRAAEAPQAEPKRLKDLEKELQELKSDAEKRRGELEESRASASSLQEKVESLEKAGRTAREEVRELRSQLTARGAQQEELAKLKERTERGQSELQESRASLSAVQEKVKSLEQALHAADAARETAELRARLEERDKQREELAELKERAERQHKELQENRSADSSLQEKVTALEGEVKAARAARETAETEAKALRSQLGEGDGLREELAKLKGLVDQHEREALEARQTASSLKEQIESLEKVRKEAEAARETADAELHELRAQRDVTASPQEDAAKLRELLEERERELDEARGLAAGLQEHNDSLEQTRKIEAGELEEAKEGRKKVELSLAVKEAALEEAQRHLVTLGERAERSEAETKKARADLASASEEIATLRSRLDRATEGREATHEDLRRRAEAAEARAAAAEKERDEARAAPGGGRVGDGGQPTRDWAGASEAVTSALTALRRTPFVPPTLRVAVSGVEEHFGSEAKRPPLGPSGTRLLLLDRNITRLEPVAAEMEAGGLEPLLAHYSEEVGFFLKTPEGAQTTAVVCDVMAFRPEQDLLDLFRSWRRDVPSLTIVLTYEADNPIEQERVSGVPPRTAGRLPMPPTVDGIQGAVRKAQADRGPEGGPATAAFRPSGGR